VDSVVYVTDIPSAGTVLDAFRGRAGGRLPAGTLVGAGLMGADARVEIMLTAGR
jgi:enamine deaminase RidA (YjgF/YER057c/UK114 family)